MDDLLGLHKEHLLWYQMGLRALIVFVLAIIMLRVAGRRTFGKSTTFDVVVGIILGGILSRSITGEIPFWESIFSAVILVVLHRVLALIICRSRTMEKLIQGSHELVFADGQFIWPKMNRLSVTKEDALESVRKTANLASLEDVDKMYYETTGHISVVKKKSNA